MKTNKRYHFIGIGGVGMGALATLMIQKGCRISGSDIKENGMTKRLQEMGAAIYVGHDAKHVMESDVVVYSSAVKDDNAEILASKQLGKELMRRAELLADLMNEQIGISVAGAHGKTTTSSMVSHMLMYNKFHPTTAVGGIIHGFKQADLGKGKYFVAEVDESDGSFLYFKPMYSIITNIDHEHVDYYETWDRLLADYKEFIANTDKKGCLFIWGEDPSLLDLCSDLKIRCVTYGLASNNEVYATDVLSVGMRSTFTCVIANQPQGMVTLNLPGEYNIRNALACLALGSVLKIPFDKMAQSLETFPGVQRRFQIKGDVNGILVIDDYAHHPTEIRETLKAARALGRTRVVTIFQPHRYTRFQTFFKDFADSLANSDEVIVTDIYAASEPSRAGHSVKDLVEAMKSLTDSPVTYVPKDKIADQVRTSAQEGDCILTLGAGDITHISEEIVRQLNETTGCENKVKPVP